MFTLNPPRALWALIAALLALALFMNGVADDGSPSLMVRLYPRGRGDGAVQRAFRE